MSVKSVRGAPVFSAIILVLSCVLRLWVIVVWMGVVLAGSRVAILYDVGIVGAKDSRQKKTMDDTLRSEATTGLHRGYSLASSS